MIGGACVLNALIKLPSARYRAITGIGNQLSVYFRWRHHPNPKLRVWTSRRRDLPRSSLGHHERFASSVSVLGAPRVHRRAGHTLAGEPCTPSASAHQRRDRAVSPFIYLVERNPLDQICCAVLDSVGGVGHEGSARHGRWVAACRVLSIDDVRGTPVDKYCRPGFRFRCPRLPIWCGKVVIRVRGCRTRPACWLSLAGGGSPPVVTTGARARDFVRSHAACVVTLTFVMRRLKFMVPATVVVSAIAVVVWAVRVRHPSGAPRGHGKVR